VESKFRRQPATKPQVERFGRACRALEKQNRLKAVTGWFVSASGFTEPARAYAREQGLLTSDLAQLNALLAQFGLKKLELITALPEEDD